LPLKFLFLSSKALVLLSDRVALSVSLGPKDCSTKRASRCADGYSATSVAALISDDCSQPSAER